MTGGPAKDASPAHPQATEAMDMLCQWMRLTQSETEAIQRDDWRSLEVAQQGKAALMGRFQGLGPLSAEIRSLSAELVSRISGQEQSNRQLLSGKMDHSRAAMQGLGSSSRQLRQLQSAYRGGEVPGWQWYS